MRDMVHVYLDADVPVRAEALTVADRVEIRLGKAFPVVFIVDRPALDQFVRAIERARAQLDAAKKREG